MTLSTSRPLWAMLAALTSTFTLSQAFRTLPAVVVGQIGAEFAVSPQAIGLFAGAFAIAFGAMQLLIGVALDRFGARRTVCTIFPLAVAGAALCAFAPTFAALIVGQLLLGASCSPAYISVLVFIVRRYPAGRFASLSGLTMSIGSIGMLITSTPLAWVVQTFGWRWAFVVLGATSFVSLAACFFLLDERKEDRVAQESFGQAIRSIGPILRMPQTAAILCLGVMFYGVFLAVRTPWIVPLFEQRYGYSLVDAGNFVLVFSLAMVLSPLPFGRLDPRGARRRYLMISCSYLVAVLILLLGLGGKPAPAVDWALALAMAALSGFAVLEYPDVRSSYPAAVVGRAIAILNMAMFFGVAIVQWLAGLVASIAVSHGASPITPVFAMLSGLLALGATGYWLLPWPRVFDAEDGRV